MTWAPARYKEPQTELDKLADPWWRLCNLYQVLDEKGNALPFRPNAVQADYYWKQWYLNIILKSRQHGFTTFMCLVALDYCIWRPNFHAHLLAHTREDSERLFEEKIRWPLRKLVEQFPEARVVADTTEDNARVLRFPSGSTFSCGTSMRGGTLQWLHISEHGKICAKFPDKAKEIRSGALNTVHAGQCITIESTAEGREGDFYEFTQRAEKRAEANAELSKLDFRFHFYPWWRDEKNVLDPRHVTISDGLKAYYKDLRRRHGIALTPGQKAWYAKKYEQQRDLMYREHPSTPAEAFQGATEYTYFGKQMLQARRQGRIVPHIPFDLRYPVNTAWDFGKNDYMAVWWHQWDRLAGMHNWLKYEEGHSEGLAYWVNVLREVRNEYGFTYGRHYIPHDGRVSDLSMDKGYKREDFLRDLGMEQIVIVERVPDLLDGIEAARRLIPVSRFSEAGAGQGIIRLENYRRDYDERTQSPKDTPAKTLDRHGADAYRQLAQEWFPEVTYRKRKRQRNWRAA